MTVVILKFYTEVRRGIWDHSFLLPICPADGHYALVAPAGATYQACFYSSSSWKLSLLVVFLYSDDMTQPFETVLA